MDEVTLSIPQGMKHYELPAGEETLDFWGRFIYKVDTESGERSRWAELRLYKIIDTNEDHGAFLDPDDEDFDMYGKELWLLYTIGHTLVYHELGSTCNRGIVVAAGDFPERAEDPEQLEPCEYCHPSDWTLAHAEDQYELEITWYSYTPCQTADKVIRSLYREPRCRNCRDKPHEGVRCHRCGCGSYIEAPRTLSIPGRRLIEQVKRLDPEIAVAAARKVKF